MRRQMTISIPEALHKRLKPWMRELNVSEICQKVLSAELDELERIKKEKKKMTPLIERLRKEKKDLANDSFVAGRKSFDDSGIENWSYADLVKLVEIAKANRFKLVHEGLWEKLLEVGETDESDWPEVEGLEKDDFARGFFARALERWNTEIKDQLDG